MQNVERELRQEVPKEKLRHYEIAARAAEMERKMGIDGPLMMDGLGQRKLKVPLRTWLRWNSAEPGCWQDKKFVADFYRDNPECRG